MKGSVSLSLLLSLTMVPSVAPVLYCYVCEDCPENSLRPLRHMTACPDESYVSCIATMTKFANFKTISRGCSKAPAVSRRNGMYNKYNGAVCSQHTVNIMRATVCLCARDTCNGPSLPPKDLIDKDEDIIDIDEVVREMNEVKMAPPEPIASGGQSAAGFTSSGSPSPAVIQRTVPQAQAVCLILLLHLLCWFS